MSNETITAKALAAFLDVDPKLFRRYVRMQATNPTASILACGSGNRYGFSKAEAHALIEGFTAWRKGRSVKGNGAVNVADVAAWLDADDESDEIAADADADESVSDDESDESVSDDEANA